MRFQSTTSHVTAGQIIQKIVKLWYEWIHSFLPKFIPSRTQHKQNLPPWITPETSSSMKQLSTLRKQKDSQCASVIAMNEKVQTAVENNRNVLSIERRRNETLRRCSTQCMQMDCNRS